MGSEKICPCGADYNFNCGCTREEIKAFTLKRIMERHSLWSTEDLEHFAADMNRASVPGCIAEIAWLILRLKEAENTIRSGCAALGVYQAVSEN
jgi:hypothetical protein